MPSNSSDQMSCLPLYDIAAGELVDPEITGALVLAVGDLVTGDEVEGDLVVGDLVVGDFVEGDLVVGDLVEGDLVTGAEVDGDLVEAMGTRVGDPVRLVGNFVGIRRRFFVGLVVGERVLGRFVTGAFVATTGDLVVGA